ncbi:MAG: MerR family transcriptional regulator [Hyphomicrobiaceae bacterium]
MNATLAKKLRFSDVVYAINGTPKSLRLWLQRGLVTIHTPKPEGAAWTTYSFIDIAILALVRQLVNFGVNVPTASAIANEVMTAFFPKLLNVQHPDKMPAGALAAMWTNRRLYVYPTEDDQWKMNCVALWESGLSEHRDENFHPDLPSGVALIRKEQEPAPVFLSIDVESVFRTAFERADESVNEGREDDDE